MMHLSQKRHSPLVRKETVSAKHIKLSNNGTIVRRPGRPKIIKTEPIDGAQLTKDAIISNRTNEKRGQISPKNKRIPRTASLVARSSWMR